MRSNADRIEEHRANKRRRTHQDGNDSSESQFRMNTTEEDLGGNVLPGCKFDVESFLLPPTTPSSILDQLRNQASAALEAPLRVLEDPDVGKACTAYRQWKQKIARNTVDPREQETSQDADEIEEQAKIGGDAREYQRKLFHMAKTQNIIIHLGTGYGKTFIALLLIKHKFQEWTKKATDTTTIPASLDAPLQQPKQCIFLVPSVALAFQHSTTLQVNLPFTVEIAASSNTTRAKDYRAKLYHAQILVATHGALKELLMHYADMFHFRRVGLLIVDECHYCSGKHAFATIMQQFYHPLPPAERPHVLGLTASPLINVRSEHSDQELGAMISILEGCMDATLVSVEIASTKENEQRHKAITEASVAYRCKSKGRWLPSADNLLLCQPRYREFRQLQELYEDLGPFPVAIYCNRVLNELSRNISQGESIEEFDRARGHLLAVQRYCEQDRFASEFGGRSDKLMALEQILQEQIEDSHGQEPIGLVFTDRRITAMALQNYFLWRKQAMQHGTWEVGEFCLGSAAQQRQRANSEPPEETIIPNLVTVLQAEEDCGDAENDPFIIFKEKGPGQLSKIPSAVSKEPPRYKRRTIKSSTLLRNASEIFNSLRMSRIGENNSSTDSWLHRDNQSTDVLRLLRRNELNLVFATSIIEEGIDVPQCSVVISFDPIRSMKSYVQMKGRARQEGAKFFVLEDPKQTSASSLQLSEVQAVNCRVTKFMTKHKKLSLSTDLPGKRLVSHQSSSSRKEEEALKARRFDASRGTVDDQSAKGLLIRYAFAAAIDRVSRLSKYARLEYMPSFRGNCVLLPSHLPSTSRVLTLPRIHENCGTKEKERLLSLMACVRLYSMGLLNERLLPLSHTDIYDRLIKRSKTRIPPAAISFDCFNHGERTRSVFVYPVKQAGDFFSEYERKLNGKGQHLAVVTFQSVKVDSKAFDVEHKQFGVVRLSFESERIQSCSSDQLSIIRSVFLLLLNERLSMDKALPLTLRSGEMYGSTTVPYLVGVVSDSDDLDWDLMHGLVNDNQRTTTERQEAVLRIANQQQITSPRMWVTTYKQSERYVLLSSSKLRCSDDFPVPTQNVRSFSDYFRSRYQVETSPNDRLYRVQRLWFLPASLRTPNEESKKEERQIKQVYLPLIACMEASLANPHIALLSCLLPQFLYVFERQQTVHGFTKHCESFVPKLGEYLTKIPNDMIATALTTRDCALGTNYDKLEWIGDAVLKLIQTDSLIRSPHLKQWVGNLDEDNLTGVRKVMGSNKRLEEVCLSFGLDRFILSSNLTHRGWWPKSVVRTGKGDLCSSAHHSKKTHADVVESILGLIFCHHGYKAARVIGDDLHLTAGRTEDEVDFPRSNYRLDSQLLEAVQEASGYGPFQCPTHLAEAFTHPSTEGRKFASYQRLEWIGDAVLCLAARNWIMKELRKMELGQMVALEAALVSNESLGFLGVKSKLHHYLDHNDHTLPTRIESYLRDIQDQSTGLWRSDPPKAISDTFESLLGAIHCDGGFIASQDAARNLLHPFLDFLRHADEATLYQMKHPRMKLQEHVGDLFHISVRRGSCTDTYEKDNISTTLISEALGRPNHSDGLFFAELRVIDSLVLHVVDRSSHAAVNRLCGTMLEIFACEPSLLSRLRLCHSRIEKCIARIDNV